MAAIRKLGAFRHHKFSIAFHSNYIAVRNLHSLEIHEPKSVATALRTIRMFAPHWEIGARKMFVEMPTPKLNLALVERQASSQVSPYSRAYHSTTGSVEKEMPETMHIGEASLGPEAMVSSVSTEENDPLAVNYGDMPFKSMQSKEISGKMWTKVRCLDEGMKEKSVLIRGRVHSVRTVGKKMAFLVVRQSGYSVQCVVAVDPDMVSPQMVQYASGLSRESLVDVEGLVCVPRVAIKGTSQKVEIHVKTIHCSSKALATLPINIEDASRSDEEIEKGLQAGVQLARVNQDTRLNYRVIDMRTHANRAIFRIESKVANFFRQFLLNEDFDEIFPPRIIAGSSEGGASVFSVDYYGERACLAQSPQFHKQMAVCGDFERVFVVGPVYRAENSFTHRHLCEFIGLDVEMNIMEHYSEVMDIVDRLFVAMFDYLIESCPVELEAVREQYPFRNLKYNRKTLRLTFEEGVKMLHEAGVNINPQGDLNTEAERKLGQLVLERHGTEFFILHRYPLAVRPFYTMPCYDDPAYSNSFDVFLRGEEIISGSQRLHEAERLSEQAKAHGIDVSSDKATSKYIDAFRYGAPLHGGFGTGLERVVMLFCGLNNIRKASLYPRDPLRNNP
uniref:aspartate--tRNA ligase n=1 Tax=Kalanchoe fedtschenkoi TaxID=63787 RepID=A0A7N1A0A1_KALFE